MKATPALPCLFLPPWCPDRLDDDLEVVWSDSQSTTPATLGDVLAAAAGRAFALVLPVERISACAITLPPGPPRLQLQALPYAVEPALAEDVDGMHFGLGEALSDGRRRVLAVNRELLSNWLQSLRQRAAKVVAIHVDADLLPRQGHVIWWDDRRCLLGGEGEARMAFSPAQWPLLAAQFPAPLKLYHAVEDGVESPAEGSTFAQALQMPLHAWLAQGRDAAVDLAQGSFAVRRSGGLRRWRMVAVAVVGCLLAQLAFDVAQAWLLQRQADGYRQANETLYRNLFPGDKRIVNLRAQFDQHLAGAAVGPQFVRLLQQVGTAMPEGNAVRIQQLDYLAATAEMTMQVEAANFEALEALRKTLQAGGLKVQDGATSRDGERVSARWVLGERK